MRTINECAGIALKDGLHLILDMPVYKTMLILITSKLDVISLTILTFLSSVRATYV